MTTDYIIKLLKKSECLLGFMISADYLRKEAGAICVAPNAAEVCERKYCDGSQIMSSEHIVTIRLSADEGKNSDNRKLFEKLEAELDEFGESRLFEQCQTGEIPLRVRVSEKATIVSDNIHTAKYRMKIKITYLKEKRG